jgi:hypothetical protein
MFDKKQVQTAIKEIDENLAALNGSRQAHIALTSGVKLVQAVCMEYFEGKEAAKAAPEKKYDGTLIPIINTTTRDKDK